MPLHWRPEISLRFSLGTPPLGARLDHWVHLHRELRRLLQVTSSTHAILNPHLDGPSFPGTRADRGDLSASLRVTHRPPGRVQTGHSTK